MKAGFQGGLVVDYPNSRKAKKFYLCLFTGGSTSETSRKKIELPQGLTGEGNDDEMDEDDVGRVQFEKSRTKARDGRGERGKKRKPPKEAAKDWILRKKEVRSPRFSLIPLANQVLFFFNFPLSALPATRKGRCSS